MHQGIVISLGSVNADFQVRVDRRPDLSETLLAHDFLQLSGGKAANVAYLARKLNVSAMLIAHVGDDALAEQALQPLRDIGVDLRHVHTVVGKPTGVSMITVPPDGKKGIILAGNANNDWSKDDIAEVGAAIADAPLGSVLVVDYEIAPFIVEHAIAAAHERDIPVILDPSPADRVDPKLFPQVTYIVPDAGEAKKLTGIAIDSVDHAMQAAHHFMEQGVKNACVKLEDGGCVLVNRDMRFHVPSIPLEVVDATGAGDAFAGALAVAVLEGRSLQDAACFATAASHAAVTKYGSQPAYPTRSQLNTLFEQLTHHAHVLS
ncbi:ribokinase [Scytonema sp. PCC 10023]|uniref:ribokinase n=1 Tax=Scytonema sp. PCC 10023 TaxID=1680591 RepID=UPI0039C6A4A1